MMKNRRLNFFHILIHGLAIHWLSLATSFLLMLTNPKATKLIHTHSALNQQEYQMVKHVTMTAGITMVVSIVVFFVASLIVSIRKKLFWVNSLLALAVVIGFVYFMATNRIITLSITWFISNLFKLDAIPAYIVTGLFWFGVGTFLLFSPRVYKIMYPNMQNEEPINFEFESQVNSKPH